MELEIVDLAAGGRGLARGPQGRVIFVTGALPGERVRAELTRERRDYAEARTLEVLGASDQRVDPPCPAYGRCGGCDLMHLDLAAQVRAKADWVVAALSRLGQPPQPTVIPSPLATAYRNRVRFQMAQGRIGFFAQGSNDLVEIDRCPVAVGGVNRLLAGLRVTPLPAGGEILGGVEVIAGEGDLAYAALHFPKNARPSRKLSGELTQWAEAAGAAGARLVIGGRPGNWTLGPRHGLVYFQGPPAMWAFPGVFCQVNFAANQLLVDAVRNATTGAPEGPVLDLYAGSGNFSLPLAEADRVVCAVESSDAAVAAARFNRDTADLAKQVDLIGSDAAHAARVMHKEKWGFTCVVLDPPRAGAKPVMPSLAGLAPSRVVYVSCHAAALARDAAKLIEAGYQMTGLTVLDMFPHTGQVETVLVLDRDGGGLAGNGPAARLRRVTFSATVRGTGRGSMGTDIWIKI